MYIAFPENLEKIACKMKEIFNDFLKCQRKLTPKKYHPYICIGNSLQKIHYLKS